MKELLPEKEIVHTAKARYFKQELYTDSGYIKVDREVGNLIDFYNVLYYREHESSYDTYYKLFRQSDKELTGTSVQELINRGIAKEKIIVGKPASTEVNELGYMYNDDLVLAINAAYEDLKWKSGIMLDEFYYDSDGAKINDIF